jgi:peptidoglycan/LPS O-acetylase OafA/YrhL
VSEKNVKPRERFVFIDALRAIVAMEVVFQHLYFMHDPIRDAMRSILPGPLRWPVEQDLQPVQVFFVISGFVIAWSLRNLTINFASAFNFILRRQIRLDPAYWVCIGLSVGCMILQAAFVDHSHWADVARPGRILLNMFYLQYFPRNSKLPMLYVAWTLCLEVQMYLVFIIHYAVIQWLIRKSAAARRRSSWVYVGLMLPVWLFSVRFHWSRWAYPYFVQSWYLYVMGVALCWVMEKRIPASILYAGAILQIIYGIYYRDPHVGGSVFIGAIIYAAMLADGLSRWLGNRVIQYFGRISYSIYLVQWDVGRTVEGWGLHFTHNNRPAALLWFVVAIAACIGVAHLLYVCVERPSMNLAARLKPRGAAPKAELPANLPAAQPALAQ